MTGWIVFLCILAVLLFILFMPVVVDFRYEGNKVSVRVSYCGLTIFDTSKKKKELTEEEKKKAEEKKKLKKKKKEEKAARKKKKEEEKKAKKKAGSGPDTEEKEEKKEKKSIPEILALVKSLLKPVGKGLRRLFKGIRITRFYLDIKVGAFDAAECALTYGKLYTAVANGLAFFQSFFVIKPDHIAIQPRFGTEATVYTARFRAKMSPAAVLAAGFSLAWTYLIQMLRKPQTSKKKNKEDSNNAGKK
ncbi:MAG: hypothetical protein IJ496_02155 [Ruminococcus sp.]|nr:hypothetical protein [Ruminococcus sp.]